MKESETENEPGVTQEVKLSLRLSATQVHRTCWRTTKLHTPPMSEKLQQIIEDKHTNQMDIA